MNIIIKTKKLYLLTILSALFGYAQLCGAMEEPRPRAEHNFPALHWDYVNNKAVVKINDPGAWRTDNSYADVKRNIESAIIDNPESTVKYSWGRFKSIVLDPLVGKNKKFNKRAVDELFAPEEEDNLVGNHYALMKECMEEWCPLTRSLSNNARKKFEDDFVMRIKRRFAISTPLRYVGFASGLSLFGELRIIMQLKMAGYQFEKIQFIDPVVSPWVDFIQQNVEEIGSQEFPLPMDGGTLESYFKDNSHHFQMVMNTHLVAQFLAILSNYPGDDIVEYYRNVADYLADDSNATKAHIVTTFDLLDPTAARDGRVGDIMRDFAVLKNHHEGALIGTLFADYLAQTPKSNFTVKRMRFTYTLISVTNECEGCKGLKPLSYCSTCETKQTGYCSTDCQRKDWKAHKGQFHTKNSP